MKRVLIFYEAPHRLRRTLNELNEVLGDRTITLVRSQLRYMRRFKNKPRKQMISLLTLNLRESMLSLLKENPIEILKQKTKPLGRKLSWSTWIFIYAKDKIKGGYEISS